MYVLLHIHFVKLCLPTTTAKCQKKYDSCKVSHKVAANAQGFAKVGNSAFLSLALPAGRQVGRNLIYHGQITTVDLDYNTVCFKLKSSGNYLIQPIVCLIIGINFKLPTLPSGRGDGSSAEIVQGKIRNCPGVVDLIKIKCRSGAVIPCKRFRNWTEHGDWWLLDKMK